MKTHFVEKVSPDTRERVKLTSPPALYLPTSGGEETLVLNQPQGGYWDYWAVVEQGIYYVNAEAKPHPAIDFFNFATRQVTQIAALEKGPGKGSPGFAVSPDGRWILCNQVDEDDNNIVLIENFQ